jgi:F0F1-type ATP synthase membrane subunit c/vacuolar-type H+-ATPase subunit K
MDGSEEVRRTYREAAIVCGAMVASVLIYAVVVEVLRTGRSPDGTGGGAHVDLLRYAFYFLAGIEGLAIPFVRRAVEAGPAAGGSLLARLRAGALVTASLAEVPAVLGLVLALLAGSRLDFYLLAGWSLLLQVFHFPRQERWEDAVRMAARRSG